MKNIFLLLLVTFIFTSCQRTESKEYRLSKFKNLLQNSEQINLFEEGRLDELNQIFIEELNKNKKLKKQYEQLKETEGIDYFSELQFLIFFRDNFYLKIKNPKKK